MPQLTAPSHAPRLCATSWRPKLLILRFRISCRAIQRRGETAEKSTAVLRPHFSGPHIRGTNSAGQTPVDRDVVDATLASYQPIRMYGAQPLRAPPQWPHNGPLLPCLDGHESVNRIMTGTVSYNCLYLSYSWFISIDYVFSKDS